MGKTFCLISLALLFFGSLQAFSSPASMRQCEDSPSSLFQQHDLIQIELTTDFNKINDVNLYPEDAPSTRSPGNLKYYDPHLNRWLSIQVDVRARGGYRFEECDYRPLKVYISEAEKERLQLEFPEYILRKAGRKLKITTVCSAQQRDKGRRSLLKEYYAYRMFGLMNTLNLKVRLVELKMKLPDGTPYMTDYAFIREPAKKAIKRCGLTPEPKVYKGYDPITRSSYEFTVDENHNKIRYNRESNLGSKFQAELFNQFLRNDDYNIDMRHNIFNPTDESQSCNSHLENCHVTYHMTYDYDLGLAIDGGIYSSTRSDRENAPYYYQWIVDYPASTPVKCSQIVPFANKKNESLALFSRSDFLDNLGKSKVAEWLNAYFGVLDRFKSTYCH